jgi:hypothetical protein
MLLERKEDGFIYFYIFRTFRKGLILNAGHILAKSREIRLDI